MLHKLYYCRMNLLQNTRVDGDDDEQQDSPDDRNLEGGDYDLGDDMGQKIGEHDEDPSL